jgi:hypothetical protein
LLICHCSHIRPALEYDYSPFTGLLDVPSIRISPFIRAKLGRVLPAPPEPTLESPSGSTTLMELGYDFGNTGSPNSGRESRESSSHSQSTATSAEEEGPGHKRAMRGRAVAVKELQRILINERDRCPIWLQEGAEAALLDMARYASFFVRHLS